MNLRVRIYIVGRSRIISDRLCELVRGRIGVSGYSKVVADFVIGSRECLNALFTYLAQMINSCIGITQ